jgi:glycosyltransferase involved in cell wall biosynthesis
LGVRVVEMPWVTERTGRQLFSLNNPITLAASYLINSLSAMASVPLLRRLIRDENIAAIHCNNMLVKTAGALAAQWARVPAVLHVRNLHETAGKVFLYGNLARLPAVRLIVSNSDASAAPYRRAAPDKVVVVHNGIDFEEYRLDRTDRAVTDGVRRELSVSDDTLLVGFTGNLIPRKGVDLLVRAAARVLETRKQVVFVAVGQVPIGNPVDYQARYESLARELGIADRFRFVGFREDVRPAVAEFDMLVLPSLQEPFGRSIIEAMALGTPVVASRVGGIPEIITDGRDGLLVEPGDVGGLAGAISSLLDDASRRAKLADAALETVRQRFDVAELTRQIEDLLLAALD